LRDLLNILMKHWPNLSNGIIRGSLYRRKG